MDYEKKYKDALEKARKLCAYPTIQPFVSDLKDLFPELAESEDEKIRKELIEYIKNWKKAYCSDSVKQDILDNFIAWLEKQGEQKPEWSEEDERKRNGLVKGLKDRMGFGWASDPFSREEYISWLKSLKGRVSPQKQCPHYNNGQCEVGKPNGVPQKQWRPTEEQIQALSNTKDDCIGETYDILDLLLRQLKAL